ncbi:MAG: hypothetical protein IT458_01710 [Planctomycetes bacterium]|nr:hypothetical protein [Planctomycetota bacterium]
MSNRVWSLLVLLPLLGAAPAFQDADVPLRRSDDPGRLTVLSSVDELTRHFSFARGEYGLIVQGGGIRNRHSQIAFDAYSRDGLTVGIEGGATGSLTELGDLRHQGTRHTLFFEVSRNGDSVVVPSLGGSGVFPLLPVQSGHSQPVRVGSIYAAKVVEKTARGEQITYALLRVVDHVPGRSVTIRWRLLD